ncbi:MAG TPA: CHAT domain-containing protein [Blastocatellia bacterium]|nr:CHAT domain-containing protein [Blastocatellia bacterium]
MRVGRRFVGSTLFLTICTVAGDHVPYRPFTIHLDQHYDAVLTESDPLRRRPPLGHEHRWRFDGQQGQPITLTAESYEFDTYLVLLDPKGREIAWNDDEGWFFNAQICTTLPVTGRYTVIVSGAMADHYGSYRLSLRAGHHARPWDEDRVRAYYERGRQWAEQRRSQRAISLLNLALGQFFRERRQWKQAEIYFARSRQVAEQAGFLFGQWAVALERGTMLTDRRRYDEALGELERALTLSARLRAAGEAEAMVRAQLGDLYHVIQKRDLAELHYRRALNLAEQSGSPSALVRVYASLYGFYFGQDQEKALTYAHRAYTLREKVSASQQVRSTYTLAWGLAATGKFEEGLRLAQEARQAAHRLGHRAEEISILTLMSMTYYKLNRLDEMVHAAREAAALTTSEDEDPEPRRIALQTQATGEMLRGNYEEALRLCLEAWHTTESAWLREPAEDLRQDFLAQSKAISVQILRILNALNTKQPSREYIRQAFNFAERSRSRALLVHLAALNRQSRPTVDPELLGQEQQLLEQISAFGRRIVLARSGIGVDVADIGRLKEERERLIAERLKLGAQLRAQAGGLEVSSVSPLTAEEVREHYLAAYPNAAILFYQLGIQESFLIVLTRQGEYLFKLPDWATIGKAVTEWRAQIRRQVNPDERTAEAWRDYLHIAHELYRMLVKPAADLIRGRDLIIVPDRMLHNLAFEALVSSGPDDHGQAPRYLIEDHAVTYAPSISVLAEIDRRPPMQAGKEVLLVGDPVFGEPIPRQSSPSGGADIAKQRGIGERDQHLALTARFQTLLTSLLRNISSWVKVTSSIQANSLSVITDPSRLRSGLQRIPSTRKEVVEIARLARQRRWRPTLWLGQEARKEKFTRADLSTYRVLHLATHGVADEKDGELSALIFSGSGDQGQNDWVLTAAEIARLRINADLVVLSACETGVGQMTSGEGVIGLSRAFMLAGARRVCGSLWKVEDPSAERLMAAFYRGMLDAGLGPARALQRAKIEFLRRGAWPVAWAPFVLIGSPR